jgi:ribosomal-protein-alanine N-acetyltransferase
VSWIRLFASASGDRLSQSWEELWQASQQYLMDFLHPLRVAAIPLQGWFQNLLKSSRFTCDHQVVVLVWERKAVLPLNPPPGVVIRPMLLDDIPQVERIDASAFGGVWQNSQSCLEIAFRQSAVATVAELDGEPVGYQISTATQMGGHLARLAVTPQSQGNGIGYALVNDLLSQFQRRGARSVTVNTQHDNQISLSIYQKSGFQLTGEEYPVFEYQINPA